MLSRAVHFGKTAHPPTTYPTCQPVVNTSVVYHRPNLACPSGHQPSLHPPTCLHDSPHQQGRLPQAPGAAVLEACGGFPGTPEAVGAGHGGQGELPLGGLLQVVSCWQLRARTGSERGWGSRHDVLVIYSMSSCIGGLARVLVVLLPAELTSYYLPASFVDALPKPGFARIWWLESHQGLDVHSTCSAADLQQPPPVQQDPGSPTCSN